MTLEVKVNVSEKKISQLSKVTFFSEWPRASADPFYMEKILQRPLYGFLHEVQGS